MKNKTITIVGMGLLGGSYAMGLSQAGNQVYGIDINPASITFAKEHNYILDGSTNPDEYNDYLTHTDILILCLYPNSLVKWIGQHIHLLPTNAIITDVCGVKEQIVDKVQSITTPYEIEFYSGHPMRGKETLGVQNADSAIFKNANYILTPTDKNTSRGEGVVRDIASTLGFSTIRILTPREHDDMIGYLSQLTHVIAVALMTANSNPKIVDFSGDSFRDLTRIAKIDEYLWSELFSLNKEILCKNIDVFSENLLELRNYIENDDIENMKKMFRTSTERRKLFDTSLGT